MKSTKTTVLFVSHKKKRCGVYQYGLNISEALNKSTKYSFVYTECSNSKEFYAITNSINPSVIIYNYHPSTLPWISKKILGQIKVPHIGTIHEVTQQIADSANNDLFDYHIAPDPTLLLKNPIVFKTGRVIPNYCNAHTIPDVPTIGSFGFASDPGKGFERLVKAVQEEYDEAVIRLHIPFHDFGDLNGASMRAVVQRCKDLLNKPGVRLILSNEFLTKEQLLEFLAKNTLNAFFYEMCEGRGISSVTDYALAVQRPIAITRCSMFRHLFSATPSICIEDSSLRQIIENGIKPLQTFYDEWSEVNIIRDYERIVRHVVDDNSHPIKTFFVRNVYKIANMPQKLYKSCNRIWTLQFYKSIGIRLWYSVFLPVALFPRNCFRRLYRATKSGKKD